MDTIVGVVNSVTGIVDDLVVWVKLFFTPIGEAFGVTNPIVSEYSLFTMTLGAGLTVYVVYVLATWILNIIT